MASPDNRALQARMEELGLYHTFQFPDGTVIPGYFDMRNVVGKLPIPASLAGKRCLDVASATGFFAIEFARRGGDVQSVDVDDPTQLDWQGPPGVNATRRRGAGQLREGFEIACKAYDVDITRHDISLYDLSPEALGSTFDFVFMGNILMHLSDPGRGLRAVRSVIAPGGELLSFEGVSLPLSVMRPFTPTAQLWPSDEPTWWRHNIKGHRRLVEAGGFQVVAASTLPIFVPLGDVHPRWPDKTPRHLHDWAFWLFTRRFGACSAWVRAVPRPLRGADEPAGAQSA